MGNQDPRLKKFWINVAWFLATIIALVLLFRFFYSPFVMFVLWSVALVWGGILAYKLTQILFSDADQFAVSEERSQIYLDQARDYKARIEKTVRGSPKTTDQARLQEMVDQIDTLVEAIEDLVDRIGKLHQDDVIRRDLQSVPQAISELEARLKDETDPVIRNQLERTLANRRQQLKSLEALQNTIKRAEIQIESALSQLGTIYSQLLTSESTDEVADYSRIAADVDEEVQLLQDHLEALREVKLGQE